MFTTTTIVLDLELDLAGDCPRGTARREHGEPQAFHGWLELAGTITALACGTSPGRHAGALEPHTTNEGATT